MLPLFFLSCLLCVSDVLGQGFVQFHDPSLNASQVEWLAALLAIPYCTTLIDLVLADDTLLMSSRQGLHKEDALLGEVTELRQEILIIVLDLGLVGLGLLLLFEKLYFFLVFRLVVIVARNVFGGGPQVFEVLF